MDFNTFINKFPIKLNEQQRSAVQAVEGAVLLLAVPGSGKTTVLVARLGYMELKLQPYDYAAASEIVRFGLYFFCDRTILLDSCLVIAYNINMSYNRYLQRGAHHDCNCNRI